MCMLNNSFHNFVPSSTLQSKSSETEPSAANNRGSARRVVSGPPLTPVKSLINIDISYTRTCHTCARNNSFLQQNRRMKGSLVTDGPAILTETSKSSDSSGRNNETSQQMNSISSASSTRSNESQLQKDAKKVDNASGVSVQNFCYFSAVSLLNFAKLSYDQSCCFFYMLLYLHNEIFSNWSDVIKLHSLAIQQPLMTACTYLYLYLQGGKLCYRKFKQYSVVP